MLLLALVNLNNKMTEQQKLSVENQPNSEVTQSDLMKLGAACLSTTVDASVLAEHTALIGNPNSFSSSSIFAEGEIPTRDDEVYRQVHIEAIQDLASSGIVRNGATASGGQSQRWGHRVFWNSGKEGTAVNTGGRAVIAASKDAAAKGWVTNADVRAIHVKTPDGQVVDILDRSDATS